MNDMVNGIKVFTKGDKSNTAIVFLHGFPYDHFMWDEQVDLLSEKYFCITYDIRGLGQSPAGDGQYTIESMADDLFSVADHFGLDKFILCGLSMGGYISLRALEREPERFKAAILLDTKSGADNNEAKIKRAMGVKSISTEGVENLINAFVPNCFAEESKQLPVYIETLSRALKSDPVGVKGCLIAMAARTDTTESLSKLEMPVLIGCGEKDTLTPPPVMKEMSDRVKSSEYFIVPGSGHMSPIENPGFVNDKIKYFLEKLP